MPPIQRHLQVHRTARYYVVGQPSEHTREIWVVCHGYGQLADQFASVFEPLVDDARVVVAPEALSRFYLDEPAKRHGPDSPVGASWMTREDRLSEISDYVAFLDSVADALRSETRPDVRITALGFSQAVATACRWAALGRTRLHRIILWGGAIAADLPTDRGAQVFQGASVVMVAGGHDTVVPVKFMQGERRKLQERGLTVELLEYDGGHALNSEALRRLAEVSGE